MKRRKNAGITDALIGEADKACACSSIVGEIIKATNEAEENKAVFKAIADSIKEKKKNTDILSAGQNPPAADEKK